MADEATIQCRLSIIKDNLEYANRPGFFSADVSGILGPTPGSFVATTAGVDVDLTNLTVPGLCVITNYDAANFVEVGIWDGSVVFYPLMDVLAGEQYALRLSASVEAGGASLRVRANTANCNISVEAFEK